MNFVLRHHLQNINIDLKLSFPGQRVRAGSIMLTSCTPVIGIAH